ncbi:energy-coupling factor transporter transmembrane protein EcfT [Myxococcaceae bacterium GXIMD 01537]
MSVGLYVPGASPVHALPAGLKLLALLVVGTALFFVHAPLALGAALAGVVALYGLAGLGVRGLGWALRPAAVVLPFLFVFHALVAGWPSALELVLRLGVLLGLATLVTLTTRVSEVLEVLERALGPLRRVGVSPARAGLMFALTVRFVPVLLANLEEIREAQRARGLEQDWRAVLVPLLVKTLRMADTLSDAIDARCFDARASQEEP